MNKKGMYEVLPPPPLPVKGRERKDYYRFGFTEQDMRDLLVFW